ncbi:MAG: VWA domain-containing protein [Myxococcota bacterium]
MTRRALPLFVLAVGSSGCDVSVENPLRLSLLLLVPALLVAGLLVQRRREVLMERFAGERVHALVTRLVPWRRVLRMMLLSVAVASITVALAGFKVGYRWEKIYRRGVDMIILLDVSRSMNAQDADDSDKLPRLVRAKREIVDLLGKLTGDRVGIVVFAGTAAIRCPLTSDYKTVELLLDGVTSELIPVQGTDIGAGIDVALEEFKTGPGKSQAIVLITDGEDHIGEAQEAAARAKNQGVRVFAIGIGKTSGAPVPKLSGGFHVNRAGDMVVTHLEETPLKELARLTGGRYVRSVTGDVDLEQIYVEGIRRTLQARDLDSQRDKKWYDRFQWLVALALLALALEPFIGDGRRLVGAKS